MKCIKCGETDHTSDASFCHMCGKRLIKLGKIIVALTIFGAIVSICMITWHSCNKRHTHLTYTKLSVDDAIEVIISDTASQISVWDSLSNILKVVKKSNRSITFGAIKENTPLVEVEKTDNTLKIYQKSKNKLQNLKVYLPYTADLESISLSNASVFQSKFKITGENVNVHASESSNFYCDIEASKVSVDLSYESNLIGDIDSNTADIKLLEKSKIKGKVHVDTLDLDMKTESNAELSGINGKQITVNASESSNFISDIKAFKVSVDLSYKSNLTGDIDATASYMNLSEQSRIKGKVRVDTLNIDMNTESNAEFASIKSEIVQINISRSSNLQCGNKASIEASNVRIDMSYESNFTGDIDATTSYMKLSEQSRIKSNVRVDRLDLHMNSASNAELVGHVKIINIDLRGISKIIEKTEGNRYALACQECTGEMSDGSIVYIDCCNKLNVDFNYKNNELHYTGSCTRTNNRYSCCYKEEIL